ncbi:MAG: (5-formylfuran-3-yl)methyl phosphate synthase [Acidobacteriota bacterium]
MADVQVTVKAVVHFRQYAPAKEDDQTEYLLFGSDGFRFAARYVKKAPDFDQMLSVKDADKTLWGGQDKALRVVIPTRSRAAEARLSGGEVVVTLLPDNKTGPMLTMGQELFLETGFLKDPMQTAPAPKPPAPQPANARNQRLLISVYDSQEAREAILGGARVIDCEDPAGALGDISPRRIMTIAEGVVQYKRDLEVQISTNIGENQLLFKRDGLGRAVQRHNDEISGKAAQAALGVAAAMGSDIHPVNIVKVGLDGMPRQIALETLAEVVQTVRRNGLLNLSEVVGVFFAQDLAAWNERKKNKFVIRDMVLVREYVVDPKGDIDLSALFGSNSDDDKKSMAALRDKLKDDTELFDVGGKVKSKVRLTELYDLEKLGYAKIPNERFEMSYLFSLADLVAEAGADGVMIDTRIHSKNAYICCLNHKTEGDVNATSSLPRKGIYSLEEFATYAKYCHEKGIMFWASGSIQPYQAQDVWALADGDAQGLVDAMAVRSGASGKLRQVERPGVTEGTIDNRATRRIYRDLVEKYRSPM